MEEDKYVLLHYFVFISILQNLLEEWRERDRMNLTEPEEWRKKCMFCYIIIFFNPPKSVGGMKGEGQKNLTETLDSPEGAGEMEEDKYFFITLFCFISIFQNLLEEWRERD